MHVRPLDENQARTFVERWFDLVEHAEEPDSARADSEAARKAKELLERLRQPDLRASRIFQMTRNPLLLTAICLVQYDRGQLPHRRVDLYEECVTTLLLRWREERACVVLQGRGTLQSLPLLPSGEVGNNGCEQLRHHPEERPRC